MELLIFGICLLASTIGGVCGIGGGIIIKPALDAIGIMSVSAISFLSGLTVLSMSFVSLFLHRGTHLIERRTGSLLAAGSVLGGILGNTLFHQLKELVGNASLVGMLQALVLMAVSLLTLLYSAYLRARLPSLHVKNGAACVAIGGLLGLLSAFLGIGGGPINLAALYFAFSMDAKKASVNSLYVILFSQLASLLTSCVGGTIPPIRWRYLIVMVAGGLLGGFLGAKANSRISARTTERLFHGLLLVICLVCLYNAFRFAS